MQRHTSFWYHLRRFDFDALTDRELVALTLLAILGVTLAGWLALDQWMPAPPRQLIISTGPLSGAYYDTGLRYSQRFRDSDINLVVQPSKGSPDNLSQLLFSNGRVSAAFLQGGAADTAAAGQVESLATVAVEPVWVFRRAALPLETLAQARGLRLAVGPAGSGTLPVAQAMLEASGVTPHNAEWRYLSNEEGLQQIQTGTADLWFVVAAMHAPIVQQALQLGLRPLSFPQAQAYTRRFPWLTPIVLPRGVLSLAEDDPPQDLTLMAVGTSLVVRADLHPAIKSLLLGVATEVHAGAGLLHVAGQFPSAQGLLLPQSDASVKFFRSGPPFLHRYLPFWWAEGLQRLALSLLPVVVVLLPGLRWLLLFRQRRNHAHILRLFSRAHELQLELATGERAPQGIRHDLRLLHADLRRLSPFVLHSVDYYRLRTLMVELSVLLPRSSSLVAPHKAPELA